VNLLSFQIDVGGKGYSEMRFGQFKLAWLNLDSSGKNKYNTKMPSVADAIGRTPNEILNNPVVDISSWHFFQASSWIDYAKRSQTPSAIHYTAFELRYGIEYLLFELLVLANKNLTQTEYEKCLGDPKKMRKMLSTLGTNYHRLSEFSEMALSIDSSGIKLRFWDINELFRFWGTASNYLHFVGAHSLTYKDTNWLIKGIATLESVLTSIWNVANPTIGIGVLRPSLMEPEVYAAWLEYSAGTLSKENLRLRLKLILPALQLRNRKLF
jgi:hypothetical protein